MELITLAPFVFNDYEKLVTEFFSPLVDIDNDSDSDSDSE